MIELQSFPMRAPVFSIHSVPRGNVAKESLPVLFRELQKKALAAPDLAHWKMLPTGIVFAVTYPRLDASESGLVLEFIRATAFPKPKDVPTFGNEVSNAIIHLEVSRRVIRSYIDDRRHEPHYPCLRYLTLIAPKGPST